MKGFSLIETMVVVGIIGILVSVVAPLSHKTQIQNGIQVAGSTFGQALQRAQTLAQNGQGDSAWGVQFSSTTITLFKGTTYVGRDSSYDEIYPITKDLTVTGLLETSFAKFTGTPSVSGTTTITVAGISTDTINVNAQGTITY